MSKIKTVFVRNHRKRVYNGVKYMGIAEINAELLDQYLTVGFYQFDPETGKDIIPNPIEDDVDETETDGINEDDYTVKDLKAYLDEHNIEYAKSAKKADLFKIAVDNGLGAGSNDDVDDSDLSALDEEEDDVDPETDLSALDD